MNLSAGAETTAEEAGLASCPAQSPLARGYLGLALSTGDARWTMTCYFIVLLEGPGGALCKRKGSRN